MKYKSTSPPAAHVLRYTCVALILAVLSVPLNAARYYVDFDGGNDANSGTSESSAWKRAPGDQLAQSQAARILRAGDEVVFKGGVRYRGSITINASGTRTSPIKLLGNQWGSERAIIDGSDLLRGWQRVPSADSARGNPNWRNLFYTDAPSRVTTYTANIHENEETVWQAQTPVQPDPFFSDKVEFFYPVGAGTFTTTSITDPRVFTQSDPRFWEESYILAWVIPNITVQREITGYSPSSNRISFTEIPDPTGYARYCIINSMYALTSAGQFFIATKPSAAGTRRLFLWPRDSANIRNNRVDVSMRPFGIDINSKSWITVEGLTIQKHSGVGLCDGVGVGTYTLANESNEGIVIRNNFIRRNQHASSGYGGVYLSTAAECQVVGNTITENSRHRGIYCANSERLTVAGNTISRAGSTAIPFYTCRNSVVFNNRISDCLGTHANGMSFYLNCSRILVARNRVYRANVNLTMENSRDITVYSNIFDGADVTTNVVAAWMNMSGVNLIAQNLILHSTNDYALYSATPASMRLVNNIIDGADPRIPEHRGNIYTGLAWNQTSQYAWSPGEKELVERSLASIFIDASNGNYHLRSGSVGIRGGVDVRALLPVDSFPGFNFNVDLDSMLRSPTDPWDIGPLIYLPTTGTVGPPQGRRSAGPSVPSLAVRIKRAPHVAGTEIFTLQGRAAPRDSVGAAGAYIIRRTPIERMLSKE